MPRIPAANQPEREEGSEPEPERGDGGEPEPGAARRPVPPVVEALGYVGGIGLLIGACFMADALVSRLWSRIPVPAEPAIPAAVAAILLLAGAWLRVAGQPVLGRLRAALWLGSASGLAIAAALLAGQVWRFGALSVVLFASAATSVYAVLLWWRNRATLQEIAAFIAVASVIVAGVVRIDQNPPAWVPGLSLWLMSLLWFGAAWRGYLLPRTAGYTVSSLGLLAGAQLTLVSGSVITRVFAIATVAGLLAAGVALDRVLLLAFGAAGAIGLLPEVLDQSFPRSPFTAGLSVFAVGCAVLAAALFLANGRRKKLPR